MDNLKEFNNLVNNYGLDEKETFVDDEGMAWFTVKFLADLLGVTRSTIGNNICELLELGEITEINCKKNYTINNYNTRNNTRGVKPDFYDMNVVYSLGMWLKSQQALKFRNNIKNLLEGLRKGDLKITSTKKLFGAIANKKTTHYREKISQKQLISGVPEHNVYTRIYNAKLNTELRKRLSKKEMSGYIPEVLRRLGKIAYKMDPSEFRALHGIENPHHTREYCTHDQNRIIQFLEEELYKRVVCHDGKLSKRQLFKYVDDCIQKGEIYSELVNEGITLHMSPIKTKQEKLDDFI